MSRGKGRDEMQNHRRARSVTVWVAALLVAAGLLVTAPAEAADPGWPQRVRMGFVPTESNTQILTRYQPLVDHLSEALGVPVDVFTASDYAGIIEAMRFKRIEAAYFGPQSYVVAAERAGAEAVAVEQTLDGTTGYRGLIISRAGSGIDTIDQIKGRSFAFTDPNSTSGYLVPVTYLVGDLKIEPNAYFSHVVFSGSHEASMISVARGTVDVAATNDLDMERAIQAGRVAKEDFNVLWTSALIPGSPIAVRGDLPESFKEAFARALATYQDREALAAMGLMGFQAADDSLYDPIRQMNRVAETLE